MSDNTSDYIPSNNSAQDAEEGSSTSPFDVIRHLDGQHEYWSARELAKVLGYVRWDKFKNVIKKAETACQTAGDVIADHFSHMGNMVAIGSGAQREVDDVLLTRYGCYLTADNADPSKPIVAQAQRYFVTSTRRDEIRRKQDIAELREAQAKRLELRGVASETNKKLAEAAQDAGVPSGHFGIFQDAGYKGLYGGLGVEGIKEKKEIPAKDDILDRMGREELGANIFRITQAEARLRDDAVQGEENANAVHHEVGRDVRAYLKQHKRRLPETLPPEPTIKPLLDEQRRRAKRKTVDQPEQPSLFDQPQDDAEDTQ